MSLSQFTIYRFTDASAPSLTGTAGSLLNVLDAVLVNGYGSKTAAGWSKPFANSGSIGCYQNSASGTNFCMSINDNGPGLGTFKEARISAYEVLSSVSTGVNPFPNAALSQGASSGGYQIIRKSATLDSTVRPWIVIADAYTVYFFALTGDSATSYQAFGFGDFYSVRGPSDLWRCFVTGRTNENTSALNSEGLPSLGSLTAPVVGNYAPRTFGGGGFSIAISKHGDSVKGGSFLGGIMPCPNAADNSIYVSPIWISESTGGIVRGRMRGMYQICHPISNFSDGQVFQGSGDFAGKTFMVIKGSVDSTSNSGMYVLEISATVETN